MQFCVTLSFLIYYFVVASDTKRLGSDSIQFSLSQKLTQGCTSTDAELPDSGEKAQEFKDNKGKVQLSVSKKTFKHPDHQNMFLKDNGSWVSFLPLLKMFFYLLYLYITT